MRGWGGAADETSAQDHPPPPTPPRKGEGSGMAICWNETCIQRATPRYASITL